MCKYCCDNQWTVFLGRADQYQCSTLNEALEYIGKRASEIDPIKDIEVDTEDQVVYLYFVDNGTF